jgi:hypothetical protein
MKTSSLRAELDSFGKDRKTEALATSLQGVLL